MIVKVANKCLNVRERVEVVEWNKRWSPSLPLLSCESSVSVKENPDRKKKCFLQWILIGTEILFNLFMQGGNKKLHTLKQTNSWKLQVHFSVYEILLQPSLKGLNFQIINSSPVTTVKWLGGDRFFAGFATFG